MKNNKKGFTLMEMLIVVAIIAVLVAIAIPVLSGTLEKSREAADAANLRAAYAECAIAVLDGTAGDGVKIDETTGDASKEVASTQKQTGWQNTTIENIGGLAVTTTTTSGNNTTTTENIPALINGAKWKVTVAAKDGKVTIVAAQ